MVSLPSLKLGDVLSSIVREIHLLVHVLNAAEEKCHPFGSRSDGEDLNHQRLHEEVRGCPASVGFGEPGHCAAGRQVGYSPKHTVFQLSLSL